MTEPLIATVSFHVQKRHGTFSSGTEALTGFYAINLTPWSRQMWIHFVSFLFYVCWKLARWRRELKCM